MFTFEGINQLVKNERVFEETYLFMLANTFKILHNFNIFDKGGQKIEQTQDFEHQFFWRHTYDTKNNLELPRNFLKERSKASQRNNEEKGRF